MKGSLVAFVLLLIGIVQSIESVAAFGMQRPATTRHDTSIRHLLSSSSTKSTLLSSLLSSSSSSSSIHQDNTVLAPSALRSMIFANLSRDQQPQLLCDFLMELGACSTSITDADLGTEQEQAIYHEPGYYPIVVSDNDDPFTIPVWNSCHVHAHFASSARFDWIAALVQDTFPIPLTYTVDDLPDRDWVIHVQQSWKPIVVNGIVLRFPWHTNKDVEEITGGDALVELKLQGGIAFGTGEHPTTQLCLGWVQNVFDSGKTIQYLMDYGSGSGVLGLAAAALSKTVEVTGVDIDVDAVRIANANAVINQLNMKTYLPLLEQEQDVESKSMLLVKKHEDAEEIPLEKTGRQYDALVANILAVPLVTLAPTLAGLLKPDGVLGLSGILAPQADMVIEAYEEYFHNVKVEKEVNGWVLICGKRKL